jgi:hypothetical protein
MTSAGTGAATLLALTLLGWSAARPRPILSPARGTPTSAPAQLAASTPLAAPTPNPPAGGATAGGHPAAGGLFGSPPATAAGATSTTAAPPASGRSDPANVARAYATGLYTVNWTRPLPGTQKLAATTPWATASATAKLAHGQHYQPPRTDPRVAAAQVDAVERVELEDADPVPAGRTYLATLDIRTSTTRGVTTSQALLPLTLVRQAGGWLVDDTQLVG